MTMYPTLTCALRTGTGSREARKLRHQGLVPATVYGHGAAVSLTLDVRHFGAIQHANHSGSLIVSLLVDGKDDGLALVKAVQHAPIAKLPTHVDLQRISQHESLQVSVKLFLEGEAAGVVAGGVLEIISHAVNLRCPASSVPDSLKHDLTEMQIGDTLLAGQLILPAGCVLLDPEDTPMATLRHSKLSSAPTAEATAAPTADAK